ncbi:MAG: hypothetical protein ACK51N_05950 [bacterium]
MNKFLRNLTAAFVLGAALLGSVGMPSSALADKLHLRDGSVIDGTIIREDDTFYVIQLVKDGKTVTEFIAKDDVRRVERESQTPATTPATTPAATPAPASTPAPAAQPAPQPGPAAAPAATPAAGKDAKPAPKLTGKVNRVAILNFGPPSSWQGKVGDTVGTEISAAAWERAIPLLEKDNIDTVIVRINSGGGLLLEVENFHRVFHERYKSRFRTVAWVESAISAAAMSPWVLEEIYMMPEGSIGGATGHRNGVAMRGIELEQVLAQMERASELGRRHPFIARAMQFLSPLSAKIDENGEVRWFNDESGIVVNRSDRVLTFNALNAIRFKVARGMAATVPELMTAMGISEYTIAGEQATAMIDDSMRNNDRTSKRFEEFYTKYEICAQGAEQLNDRNARMTEVGRARNFLRQMRGMVEENPNFGLLNGTDAQWFANQEDRLRRLAR